VALGDVQKTGRALLPPIFRSEFVVLCLTLGGWGSALLALIVGISLYGLLGLVYTILAAIFCAFGGGFILQNPVSRAFVGTAAIVLGLLVLVF